MSQSRFRVISRRFSPFLPWKTIEPKPRRRLMAETQEILPLKSPRGNVTIAWLISGKIFDLLISLSCLFLMRRKPTPYLRMSQMKINTLFKDRNPQKAMLSWVAHTHLARIYVSSSSGGLPVNDLMICLSCFPVCF